MRIAVVFALVLFGCGSKKDPPAPTVASGSAVEPKGSDMAKGSDAPKGSDMAKGSDAAAGSGSGSAIAAGSGSDAGSAAGSGSGAGSGANDAGWEFAKLDHQAQMDFMKKTVVPTMKPI